MRDMTHIPVNFVFRMAPNTDAMGSVVADKINSHTLTDLGPNNMPSISGLLRELVLLKMSAAQHVISDTILSNLASVILVDLFQDG